MIKTYAYDVEVLPNFFSVTIINVNNYLNKFKDCCNISYKKEKEIRTPIPLVQKYTVKEIKSLLNTIENIKFYITDKDDSQLLQMLSFFNQLRPHFNNEGVAIRNDLFGYNSNRYDKLMIAALLMYANQVNSTKELITKLYEISKKLVNDKDKDILKNDYIIKSLYQYKLPFVNVDIMTIFALNKVGKGVDAKGNTIYFPKGLKQTSINLQWYELLEYNLPPISELDAYYYNKIDELRGLPIEELNKRVNTWDRYIIDDWIPDMLHYNTNDVFIVCEMIRLYIDEIRLRYNISKAYNVDVLSSSRSNIADNLFIKFYSEFSGLEPHRWRGKKTERTAMAFKRVIFDFIKFKTPELQEMLNEMKQVIIYSLGKKGLKEISYKHPNFKYLKTDTQSGWFEVKINKLVYSIATGGLHSQDIPRELRSKIKYNSSFTGREIWNNITDDSYIYIHTDIASFYPSLMSVYKIAPKHINNGCFVKLITWLKDTRVQAKHSTEEFIDGIPKDVLAQVLKIVINSIYGKLGFEAGDICDRLAVLQVTINGQLMVMMLCEELELNGIEVVSANTDGIVIKLYKKDKEKYEKILKDWLELTKLEADSEEYECYINRDINNYCIKELNGKISYKGALNPLMYAIDLQKGYDMPIVAKAVVNFFLDNKPVLETFYEAENILDFCKTQNVGRQYNVEFTINGKTEQIQRNVRFYVSNGGGIVEKVHKEDKSRNGLCAGQTVTILNTLDDKSIAFRNINYNYYYNEAIKIIDPIKLQISPNQKGNKDKGTKSGKALIKQYSGCYNTLFDDNDE